MEVKRGERKEREEREKRRGERERERERDGREKQFKWNLHVILHALDKYVCIDNTFYH